jgi:hypothetical protein
MGIIFSRTVREPEHGMKEHIDMLEMELHGSRTEIELFRKKVEKRNLRIFRLQCAVDSRDVHRRSLYDVIARLRDLIPDGSYYIGNESLMYDLTSPRGVEDDDHE